MQVCLIKFTQDAKTDKKKQNAIFQGTLSENTNFLVIDKKPLYFTHMIQFPFHFQVPIHKKKKKNNQMLQEC